MYNDSLFQDSNKYDDWRHFYFPHLGEVLAQFPSCRPQASLLAALLPPLQPRFYSISSSPLAHPNKIHVTVAVVVYKTESKCNAIHYLAIHLSDTTAKDEPYCILRNMFLCTLIEWFYYRW